MADFDPIIFKALKSSDPEQRKKGVKALARTGEREALRYLATIYKEDPDPEVRQLALDGGKHVKRMMVQGDWVGDGSAVDKSAKPTGESALPPKVAEQSKKMMEQALDHLIAERYEKAEEIARQAFQMNKYLGEDNYYRGLAGEIMGMDVDQAVAELLRPIEE